MNKFSIASLLLQYYQRNGYLTCAARFFSSRIMWYRSQACSNRKETFRTFHKNQSDSSSLNICFCLGYVLLVTL